MPELKYEHQMMLTSAFLVLQSCYHINKQFMTVHISRGQCQLLDNNWHPNTQSLSKTNP